MNEGGGFAPGFKIMGFKSHSDYVAQGCLLRVDASGRQSKLTPSNSLTPGIYWTSDMADSGSLGHALQGSGPQQLRAQAEVCCPQLSGHCSDVRDDYSVIAVDRSFSPRVGAA